MFLRIAKRQGRLPHKKGSYAVTYRVASLPQRFLLPPSGHPHCSRVNDRILGKQRFDVLGEGVRRIDGVEPVGYIAEMGIEFVGCELPICDPCVGKSVRNTGIDNYDGIPKTTVVGTDITNNGDATQPTAHVLKLWDAKTTAYSFFCSAIVHIAIRSNAL